MLRIFDAGLTWVLVLGAAAASERSDVMCPTPYALVCGLVDRAKRTFSNACRANAAGALVVAQGACSSRSNIGGSAPKLAASPPRRFAW